MSAFSTHNVLTLGANFIPTIEQDQTYRNDGVIYGHNDPWYWAVVDPMRHPLYVWPKKGTGGDYTSSAKALSAVVFSNGPMMGRLSPTKMVSMLIVIPTVIGLIGYAIGGPVVGLIAGGFSLLTVYLKITKDWDPLGPVFGRHHGVQDSGIKNPDPWLAIIGRSVRSPMERTPISDYVMRIGTNDSGLDEAIGGLIPLIQSSAIFSSTVGATNYNPAFAGITNPQVKGVVAWGLIFPPITEGALIVIGSDKSGVSPALPGILAAIKVRDAAAMDGNNSVLLGEHNDAWFEPPNLKERIEKYGFYCGTFV
jgi:hypothetical protein